MNKKKKTLLIIYIVCTIFVIAANVLFLYLKIIGVKIVMFHPELPLIEEYTGQVTNLFFIENIVVMAVSFILIVKNTVKKNG